MDKRKEYLYLEFAVSNDAEFQELLAFFNALKVDKAGCDAAQNACFENDDISGLDFEFSEDRFAYDVKWADLLNEKARNYFCAYAPTPNQWDFESLLSAIYSAEYELVSLERDTQKQGVLFFNATTYPFGSIDALQALIEAFGHRVTYNSFYDSFREWQRQQAS